MPLHAHAFAKVNLALSVGPALPPSPPSPCDGPHAGYHPIASWMHAIDLHDEITLAHARETSYDIRWADDQPVSWALGNDLCVRAHHALQSLAGCDLPATITVRKSIPEGGGLGGGSADAGTVLLGLRDLFALDLDDAVLAACAHALGTDIPFFVDPVAWMAEQPPRPALVTGVGDRIERIGRLDQALTLICPPFGCPTGAVYRAFDAAPTRACDEPRVRSLATPPIRTEDLFNDLTEPAERVEPRLRLLRNSLADALGVPVHVSGSGSTLFCLMEPERIHPHAPDCRVIGTRLV